jgi:hypothetical protein
MAQLSGDGCRTDVREIEPGLIGIGTDPSVGVGQRAVLVRTSAGNLLWDPPAFIDAPAVDAVRAAGGLSAVTASHPHMYGAITAWADAFGAEVLLAEADHGWLMRPPERVRLWSGTREPLPGVTLVQCGGHFAGSAVLHWTGAADGRGVILCGDTLMVTPGEDRVSFVWSAPTRLPLPEPAVRGVAAALAPLAFDRIYGGWWSPGIRADASRIVERSAARYIELLRGGGTVDGGGPAPAPVPPPRTATEGER